MPVDNLSQSLPSLASLVERQPLIVTPDRPLVSVMSLMSQANRQICLLPDSERATSSEARSPALAISIAARHSAVLVTTDERLVGIFNERDLVKLTASQTDFQGVSVGEVMTANPQTLMLSDKHTAMTALAIFQHHHIRHLPILDARHQLLGIVTPEQICQVLQPVNLLKFRLVSEVMTTDVVRATPTTTVLEIAQMMVERNIGSVVIVDGQEPLRAVGIVTERDIVQFQAFELDLERLLAQAVMSSPVFWVQSTDPLWAAQQIMHTKNICRLVVTNERGELAGILTQSNLLQLLDPLEMLYMVENLNLQLIEPATPLEQTNREMQVAAARTAQVEAELRRASQTLQERVEVRTAELAILTQELHVQSAEHRASEIALEASQQGISDFIENAAIGMDWIDLEGNIVWVNQAELNLFGYDRSQYLGQPLINFHVDRSKIADLLRRVSDDESVKNCDAQVWCKDGSICDVSIDAQAFFKDGKFIHARLFTRDITDQKKAEAAFKQTLESLQFQKYALDRAAIVATTDRDGIIIDVNDKFCEISQYSKSELLGKTHRVINSGYHPPEFFRDLWAVISSGQVWSGEIKNRAKDGSYYWVATTIVPCLDEGGQPFQYLSIRFDITSRKQAEESVKQSELKFRAIFDNTFQFVGLLDVDGKLLAANRTALEAIGATPEQVVGQAFWATPWWTYSPDLQVQLQQGIEQAATGELVRFEAKHFLADGSDVIVDFSLSPIKDETGKVVMLIPEGRDITDRKRIEAALQESEARYRALLTAAPVGIFQADVTGNKLFFNQQCLNLMGLDLSSNEVLGLDAAISTLHPDDREWVSARWLSAVQAKQEFAAECRFLTPQGRVNWVFVNAIGIDEELGSLTGYIGTMMDITEQQAALRERKAKEQKIQEQAALLDIATDAIIVRDLDNQIQFWNKGAESIYGWQASEALGHNVTQLLYADIPLETQLAAQLVREQGAWQGELHKLTQAGKAVVVQSRWTLVRDETGNPKSILSVDTDITEKKSLEQQFLRAQRLESLGSLASGIAHDLNNVLTPIVGAAQLLPMTLPNLDDRSRRLLDMLVDSSKRGSGLIKQILTFARGMDGERTTLQVRHILSEIISVARQTFPKSIEINLALESQELWMVNVDATQIHQVLMNLFVNARDALPDGGQITATAANMVIDAANPCSELQLPMGLYISIAVTDTGIGMSQELRERIFEPFFTTKETGTGLGLSTVLGIVKAHGGAIAVESEVGRGTCFTIYLPAIVDLPEVSSSTVAAARHDGQGQLVLVVDDELAIRNITKESLEEHNYRVMLASDGIEAIAIYAQAHHSIAIVLIDLMMPNLDTTATIKALQRIDPQVQIVVMSGSYANLAEIVDRQTVKAVVTKPFSTTTLLQALASIQRE